MPHPPKILACAPSNAAVDILAKNLMEVRKKYSIEDGQKKIKLVRFGVLENMDRLVRSVSLQELTKENNQKTVLLETKIKNVAFDEKCLLEGANVICTTLNSCCALSSKISSMDICIIDEATQCNEPTSLIPLQFGAHTVAAVIVTPFTFLQIAKQYNSNYTVFNLNSMQSKHTEQKHISNSDEAKFVRNLLDFLITKADPKTYSYGIISAYSQQKHDLAKDLSLTHPYVSVNTIDSCLGQERYVVIISIARTRGISFLAIRQRLNVALTRAKKMLILCGNFSSLQSHPMWTSLLDDAKNRKVFMHLPGMADSLLTSYFEKTLL